MSVVIRALLKLIDAVLVFLALPSLVIEVMIKVLAIFVVTVGASETIHLSYFKVNSLNLLHCLKNLSETLRSFTVPTMHLVHFIKESFRYSGHSIDYLQLIKQLNSIGNWNLKLAFIIIFCYLFIQLKVFSITLF